MRRTVGLLALFVSCVTAAEPYVGSQWICLRPEALAADEKKVIAAQIRKQGFPCERPLSAERDPQHSKPNVPAWILKCENARYRVGLVPHRPARVERID